jgi:glycerol kinase
LKSEENRRPLVVRPSMTETTARGAAFLAGLGVGIWKDVGTISELPGEEHRFESRMPRSRADELRQRWNEAVSRAKNWDQ